MRKTHVCLKRKKKKCLNKAEKFCQEIIQGLYFICTVCHWCFHKRSVRLLEHEKYHIRTTELYCLVRLFDERTYICNVINALLEIKCHVKQSSIK